jgi:hypothetical protein
MEIRKSARARVSSGAEIKIFETAILGRKSSGFERRDEVSNVAPRKPAIDQSGCSKGAYLRSNKAESDRDAGEPLRQPAVLASSGLSKASRSAAIMAVSSRALSALPASNASRKAAAIASRVSATMTPVSRADVAEIIAPAAAGPAAKGLLLAIAISRAAASVSAPRRLLIKARCSSNAVSSSRASLGRISDATSPNSAAGAPVQPKCCTHALRAVAKLAKAIAQPRAPVMTRLLVQPGDMRECRRS